MKYPWVVFMILFPLENDVIIRHRKNTPILYACRESLIFINRVWDTLYNVILTRMNGFQKLITATILEISTSMTFLPIMHFKNLTKEIKSKTVARFELVNKRLLD